MSDPPASSAVHAASEEPKTIVVPKEGDIIAGKFKVERVLATGGMGIVFEAQHLSLDQKVAVKMMLPKAMELPSAIERFQREAQAAAGIENEHVVRIFDIGTLEGGVPYMVMEHLVGCDLGDLVKGGKSIPAEHAVDYVLQACEAMAEAHRLGIVHRDLKPGNVFLTKRDDGTPLIKILDFGISKLGTEMLTREQGSLTSTSMMMGSPLYMSPEQIRSAKNVDRRADIWSLGIILFELLTGLLPFEGENAIAICAQIAADPPVPLRFYRPELPEELEAVIQRCLEKEPERRYDDVGSFARALTPFASAAGQRSVQAVTNSLRDPSQMPTLHAAKIKLDVRGPARTPDAAARPAKTLAVEDDDDADRRSARAATASGARAQLVDTQPPTSRARPRTDEEPRPERTAPKKKGNTLLFALFSAIAGYGAWTFRAHVVDTLHGFGVSGPLVDGIGSNGSPQNNVPEAGATLDRDGATAIDLASGAVVLIADGGGVDGGASALVNVSDAASDEGTDVDDGGEDDEDDFGDGSALTFEVHQAGAPSNGARPANGSRARPPGHKSPSHKRPGKHR